MSIHEPFLFSSMGQARGCTGRQASSRAEVALRYLSCMPRLLCQFVTSVSFGPISTTTRQDQTMSMQRSNSAKLSSESGVRQMQGTSSTVCQRTFKARAKKLARPRLKVVGPQKKTSDKIFCIRKISTEIKQQLPMGEASLFPAKLVSRGPLGGRVTLPQRHPCRRHPSFQPRTSHGRWTTTADAERCRGKVTPRHPVSSNMASGLLI
ncbi:hypothetical protein B0T21DRAFT_178504 [Apiosordaria backusii]|uniref:Uncharacterized protein n=1 Tax=Apiosordaria backusii TaxID=314023 RepID=A0AA40BLB1_9PEZI|nr:hypothetical protein B0T21DRAFT_178504 [Apiosordaria backusii]